MNAHDRSSLGVDSYADGFRTYSVQWTHDTVVRYADGIETARYAGDDVLEQLMCMIANLAVGGNFDTGVAVDIPRFGAQSKVSIIIWRSEKVRISASKGRAVAGRSTTAVPSIVCRSQKSVGMNWSS